MGHNLCSNPNRLFQPVDHQHEEVALEKIRGPILTSPTWGGGIEKIRSPILTSPTWGGGIGKNKGSYFNVT